MARRTTTKRPRQARRKTAAPRPAQAPPQVFVLPGRRTALNDATAREIAGHVANCASFKDACLLSGVEERTGLMWLAKGEAALRQGGAATENEAAYVHFVHLIEGGKAKRRTLLKLQMRRAAQGTDKRPGDWRAAHALGAITDSEEFVIEQRIKFSMEREEALDRLEAAFDGAPEQLTRDQACELALLAIAGRVRLEPLAQADGSTSSSGGRTDPGSGEAVHAAPAAPEAAGVPRT